MLNKLLTFIRRYSLITPGEHIVCAVSGGADSVALLFGMYLLQAKLNIRLSAAHFNHHLRGEESQRDEQFVRDLCDRFDIPLFCGEGQVTRGEKGLEAAARDARYAFLRSLDGKIATAHTADDNAETVLLHLVRGTGLKGLGGISPVNGNVIRPMLSVTRQEVERFLEDWSLTCVQDSSNEYDEFLRNRIRHHVMPVLKEENPRLAENLSAMALRLRQDEACLAELAQPKYPLEVEPLKAMHPALRSRVLEQFLKDSGIPEPEAVHIAQAEALIFSEKPSARADFPGNITVSRSYGFLEVARIQNALMPAVVQCPGSTEIAGWRVVCTLTDRLVQDKDTFTVVPSGRIVLRSREAGDQLRLPGGTKSLKKLFIDRKVPAAARGGVPVLADDAGVLGVYGIGANMDRMANCAPAVQIKIEKLT